MSGTFELGLTITSRGGQQAAEDVKTVQRATVDLTAATSQGTQVLLDKYDQQGAALRRLKSDYLDLQAEMKAGFVSPADAGRATAVLSQMEQQMGSLASATDKSAFSTANARRELIVMGHEAMTGNFSRMPGSFMVLAERVGMTTALFNPFTLGIVASAAAIGGLVVAMAEGHDEMVAMDNALAITSDYSGLTRGGMESLAQSMANTGQVTVGTAKDIVTALVSSGRIGADSIGAIAQLSANYAEATGQDVAKIAPAMIKLFADPLKGAEQLNESMHFLTASDIEHIATLERLGEVQQAQLFLAEKVTAQMPDQAKNVGDLSAAYQVLKNVISGAVDAMMSWGKTPTAQSQATEIEAQIASLQKFGAAADKLLLRSLESRLPALQAQILAENDIAAAQSVQADALTRQKMAQKEIDKSATHQLAILQLTLDNLTAQKTQTTDMLERERELRNQIATVQNSMSADARVAQDGEINNALKMQEITLSMAAQQNDAQLKLGTISKADHDATKTFLALEKNQVETIATAQLDAVAGLTAAQKQQYANRLSQLAGEKAAIEQTGATQQLIDQKTAADAVTKSWTDMEAAIAKASSTELSSLDKAIQAQQAHNDEIGKTPAQIAAVKAAITDQATAEAQASADAIDAMLARQEGDANYVALSPQVIAVYQQISASLHAQVADQQKLSALQQDGSILAANAAAAKAASESWQKGWKETDRIVRDTFVSWATQGGSMAQKIGDALKQSLVSAIYEAELKPLALQLYTSATGALGMSGSPASSATGLVNTASNGVSLYNGLTAAGAGASAASLVGANAVGLAGGDSMGALIAGNAGTWGVDASAVGGAAGATGGAMAAIGTAMPYVALAIAAYELFAAKGGGPQTGQYGTMSGTGAYTANYTMSGGDALGNQSLSTGILQQITAIATAAGKSAADVSISQGYKLDPQGTSPGIAYRDISVAGQQISGGNIFSPDYTTSHDNGAGVATYLGTLNTSEIQALVTALGDPKLITASNALMAQYGELEKSLPAYLNAQAMQSAMSTSMMTDAEKLKQTTDQMDAGFAALGVAVPKSTEDFRALINGIDLTTDAGKAELAGLNQLGPEFLQVAQATGTATTAAVTAVRSAADIANERQNLQDQLDQLTMTSTQLLQKQRDALDASNQALFDQVQAATSAKAASDAAAQAATDAAAAAAQAVTDAQNTLMSAYQSQSSALQSTITQFNNFHTSLLAFRDSLMTGNLSTLSPAEKYQAAKDLFEQTYSLAKSGDPTAVGNLQNISQQFLTASQAYNASSSAYGQDFSAVSNALSATAITAQTQADIAQTQLTELQSLMQGLININTSVISVHDAVVALQTALAAQASAAAAASSHAGSSGAIALNSGALGQVSGNSNPIIPGLSVLPTDSATMAAAKILYQSATGGVSSALYNQYLPGGPSDVPGWNGDPAALRKIYGFSGGGVASNGLYVAGENGPEVIEGVGATRIYPADQTSALMARLQQGGDSGETSALLKDVLAELRALVRQGGAVAAATVDKLSIVADKIDATKRQLARAA